MLLGLWFSKTGYLDGQSARLLAQALHEHSSTEKTGIWRDERGRAENCRNAARRRGEKIVMTNGCFFDILHAGHVSYLKAGFCAQTGRSSDRRREY